MTTAATAQDIGATFGSFASEAAYEVAEVSADWFVSRRDAGAMVERYTSAAVWCFAQSSPGFLNMPAPKPAEAMKAYQTNRLARFVGVAPNQKDADVWRMLQEDAEVFARILMAPDTQSSATPLECIADLWFAERAGGAPAAVLPEASAARTASATGHLYSAVTQLVARVTGG